MDKGHVEPYGNSVIPGWLTELPFQQQSVVLLGLRGPDNVRKYHPAKAITIAYRATVLRAAKFGRFLNADDSGDTFMSLTQFHDPKVWKHTLAVFFDHIDELPHHYTSHLAHGAQIIAIHHPLELFRRHWGWFYTRWVEDAHLNPETPEQMNQRLNDFKDDPAINTVLHHSV